MLNLMEYDEFITDDSIIPKEVAIDIYAHKHWATPPVDELEAYRFNLLEWIAEGPGSLNEKYMATSKILSLKRLEALPKTIKKITIIRPPLGPTKRHWNRTFIVKSLFEVLRLLEGKVELTIPGVRTAGINAGLIRIPFTSENIEDVAEFKWRTTVDPVLRTYRVDFTNRAYDNRLRLIHPHARLTREVWIKFAKAHELFAKAYEANEPHCGYQLTWVAGALNIRF